MSLNDNATAKPADLVWRRALGADWHEDVGVRRRNDWHKEGEGSSENNQAYDDLASETHVGSNCPSRIYA